MGNKMTINDIAQLSGVAKSTVSRYLNGGSVRYETGQKIKKVIEENHYEPNVFARLSAKNSQIIGLVVPGFNSVTTPRLVEVIVAYLKKSGYTPMIMHTGNDLEEEVRCMERLKRMNVDGMMVLSTGITDRPKNRIGISDCSTISRCRSVIPVDNTIIPSTFILLSLSIHRTSSSK